MTTDEVVLVDENDQPLGTMEKMQAHLEGRLHRAFSVFIFNSAGQLLIHRRAEEKYHSGGLWTNTCCSHPRPGEAVAAAASRRLFEEMGINCELEPAYSFIYRAEFGNGLTEHEFDHVFTGFSDARPRPDPAEVSDWHWINPSEALADISARPELYTAWYRLALPRTLSHINGR